jgi:hypothetical protein
MASRMTADEKRILKLKSALDKLRRKENVQNRQLKALLGDEAYARFEDDWRQQQQFREELKDKPDKIIEYEQLLKEATFAYRKADSASRKGRRKAAKKLFGASEALFERLLEFLSGQIAGDHLLEMWLDRDVCFDASNAPVGSSEDFPCVVTSRSLRNNGGGFLGNIQTINETKIAAVEWALNELTAEPVDDSLMAERMAAFLKPR